MYLTPVRSGAEQVLEYGHLIFWFWDSRVSWLIHLYTDSIHEIYGSRLYVLLIEPWHPSCVTGTDFHLQILHNPVSDPALSTGTAGSAESCYKHPWRPNVSKIEFPDGPFAMW